MKDSELDPLELRATPQRVRLATRAANLPDAVVTRGVEIATATPDPAEWRRFLSAALAYFGAGLLLSGVICFVAYNWTRIGRYGKFALLELAIVGAAVLGWKKLPKLSGQLALLGAAVLVGPLLAVYGQTYQTGADPYGLFLAWSVLILPWAVTARFGAIWLLALLLMDVALVLFYAQVLSGIGTHALGLPLGVALLHIAGLGAWEWQMRRSPPLMDEDWVARVVALGGFVTLFIPAAAFVVTDTSAGLPGAVGVLGLAAAIGAVMWYYRRVRTDRFMMTLAATAGMAWITVVVGRVVFEWLALRELGMFIMAAFVIWQITFGLKLYRRMRAS